MRSKRWGLTAGISTRKGRWVAPDTLPVIEVADTSVAYDRDVKAPPYARGDRLTLLHLPTVTLAADDSLG